MRRAFIAALLSTVAGAVVSGHQPAAPRVTLAPDTTITREQPANASTTFEVTLAADQATVVDVQQLSVDVTLIVRDPENRVLIELDSAPGSMQFERASIIAGEPGVYTIEVRPGRVTTPVAGSYSLALEPIVDATPAMREHFRAERLMAQADLRRIEGTKSSIAEAVRLYEEAIPIWTALDESLDLANALNITGETVYAMGDTARARDYLLRALPAWRAANNLAGEAQTLNNLGVAHRVLGELPRALEFLQQSLELRRQTKDKRGEGQTLSNMASVYVYLEDYHRALDLLRLSLPIRREVRDVRGEANVLHIMGAQHFALGDYDEAHRLAMQALLLRRQVADRPGEASTLDALGLTERARGNTDAALKYLRESLEMRITAGDVLGEAATRHKLGDLLSAGGGSDPLVELERALVLARQVKDVRIEGDILHSLGEWYWRHGDAARARDAFEQALAIRRRLADASHEAATLVGLATLERRTNLHEAKRLLETALDLVESVHRRLGRDDLRASLLASRQPHFDAYVDVLLDLHQREPTAGHDIAALLASDRARARNLRELLAEVRVPIREGVPAALLEREVKARQQLQAREADRMRVAAQSPTGARMQDADRAVASALAEYREVLGELRRVSPRYAALTQSPEVTLDAIRRVIADDTVVLTYWLGRTRSAAFVVSKDAVRIAVLPVGRGAVEAAARRLHEALSKGTSVLAGGEQQQAQDAVAAMVLRPVAAWLSRERVVVVPDGALQYVPFAALSLSGGVNGRPMVVDKELVQAPSLAAMVALDAEATPMSGGGMRIAVLADPVLTAGDPRVAKPGRVETTPAQDEDLRRSATAAGLASFPRLPFTREEATAIGKLATAGGARLSLDFEASRSTALDPQLAGFDVVHIAAHGLVNAARPELSGVVLSLVDATGRTQDGFLRMHDIYNMKLSADLVVLSACRTALGADIRGEGLVGLTRGFMYAGASRVVASLWDVRDRSTSELMTRFYRHMLQGGLSPAAALRQAQRSMWNEPRWRHPSHWGAFLLQGSWK